MPELSPKDVKVMLGPFCFGELEDAAGRQFYVEGDGLDTFGWLSVPIGSEPAVKISFRHDDGLVESAVIPQASRVGALTNVHRPDLALSQIGDVAREIQSHHQEAQRRAGLARTRLLG